MIIFSLNLPIPLRRDYCFHFRFSDLFNNTVGIVSSASQKIISVNSIDKFTCLGTVGNGSISNNCSDRHSK